MMSKYYKFLYKKLSDDLKDSEALINWAYCAKEDGETELAKYFGETAAERLNNSFKATHAMFENYAKKEPDFSQETVSVCLWDEIHEEMMDKYSYLLKRLEKL